jgi:hypothetical protein
MDSSSFGYGNPFKGVQSPWSQQPSTGTATHNNNKYNLQLKRQQQYGVSTHQQFKSPVIPLPALRRNFDQEEREAEYLRMKENKAYSGSQPVKSARKSLFSSSLLLTSKNQLLNLFRLFFMTIGVVMSLTFIWSKMTYIPGFQSTVSKFPRMFSSNSDQNHQHHHHKHSPPPEKDIGTSEPKDNIKIKEESEEVGVKDEPSVKEDQSVLAATNGTLVVASEMISTTCDVCDRFISTSYEV